MDTTNNKAAPRNGAALRTPPAHYKQSGILNKAALSAIPEHDAALTENGVTEVTRVQASNDGLSADTPCRF